MHTQKIGCHRYTIGTRRIHGEAKTSDPETIAKAGQSRHFVGRPTCGAPVILVVCDRNTEGMRLGCPISAGFPRKRLERTA